MPSPVRGACPGVMDPMESGDGWLLRIRLPGGTLTPEAMVALADVAEVYGSGAVALTSRANVQVRGIAVSAVDDAGMALVEHRLALADPQRDRRRAIVAGPLRGHDPAGWGDVVGDVERRLVDAELAGSLPAKFGVVVDDGGSWPLDDLDADVRLVADEGGWSVVPRGSSTVVPVADPAAAAVAVARWCAEGARRSDGLAFGDAGAELGPTGPPRPWIRRTGAGPGVGVRDHVAPDRANVVAAPFLGRLDARALRRLALVVSPALAVRLTPARSIALCGVPRAVVPGVIDALDALGLSSDADDPGTALSACVGAPGCARAHADTWAEARRRSAAPVGRLHLSGCDKRCGAPAGVAHLVADGSGRFSPAEPAT